VGFSRRGAIAAIAGKPQPGKPTFMCLESEEFGANGCRDTSVPQGRVHERGQTGHRCSSCRVTVKSGLNLLLRQRQLTPTVPVE
jgi:hypothetical protein